MSDETTTTTTTTEPKPPIPPPTGWGEVVDASAAQRPDDPPPRFFLRELDVELPDAERVNVSLRCFDKLAEIEDFDTESKAMAAERKAERAKMIAEAKDLQGQIRTGRVKRKVRCSEYTSYGQHRKFVVRMDKKNPDGSYVEIEETPLTPGERQRTLPNVVVDAPKKEVVDEHGEYKPAAESAPEGAANDDDGDDTTATGEEEEDGDAPFEDDENDEEEEGDDEGDDADDDDFPPASAKPADPSTFITTPDDLLKGKGAPATMSAPPKKKTTRAKKGT